jgi:GGDEF domain-containing protein
MPTVFLLACGAALSAALASALYGLGARTRRLREEVRLLRLTLDHTSHGIQMIDRDGRIVVANRRVAEFLNLPPEVLAAKPFLRDLVPLQARSGDLDDLPPEIRAQLAAGVDVSRASHTYRRRRKDGLLLEVQSIPLPDGGAVRTHTDVTLRAAADAKIAFMARHDGLTGLANRHLFIDQLTTAVLGEGATLLCIDLDRFKQVNDTLGHPVGDAVLRGVAGRLLASVTPGDTVARLGGDEFAVVHPRSSQPADAETFASALIATLRRHGSSRRPRCADAPSRPGAV